MRTCDLIGLRMKSSFLYVTYEQNCHHINRVRAHDPGAKIRFTFMLCQSLPHSMSVFPSVCEDKLYCNSRPKSARGRQSD